MKAGLVLIFLSQLGFSFGFLHELDFQVDNVQNRHGWVGTRTGPGQETVDNVVNPEVANLANTMVGCHQDGDRNAENKMKLVVRLKRMAECGRRTEMGSRIWL